jgi:hypothetical protein
MASRVTARDGKSRGARALRVAFLAPPTLLVMTAVAGCPARQAMLDISPDGVTNLVEACTPCVPSEDGGIEPACACVIRGHAAPDLQHRALQAQLFLVTPVDKAIRDTSKCMNLLPCGDAGLPTSCLAERLNQQLDGAIPRGVGFNGLENPDEVQLIIAFYQQLDGSPGASCQRSDLVACTGLAPPLGGGRYDISCASCQGGSRNAPGPDNGPCPQPGGTCFLQDCEEILRLNGY